jgi:hypothetical protein
MNSRGAQSGVQCFLHTLERSMTMQQTVAALRPPSDPSPRYLQEHPIEHATIKEVAPGVHWVRMPLPMAALEHINLWIIDDGQDFVMIDTGFSSDETRENWEIIFESLVSIEDQSSFSKNFAGSKYSFWTF